MKLFWIAQIWNDTKVEPISWEPKRKNWDIFCVGDIWIFFQWNIKLFVATSTTISNLAWLWFALQRNFFNISTILESRDQGKVLKNTKRQQINVDKRALLSIWDGAIEHLRSKPIKAFRKSFLKVFANPNSM